MNYYKTNDTAVMAVWRGINTTHKALAEQASKFAEAHGASGSIRQSGLTDIRFGGLVFDPKKDSKLWTKPYRESRMQRPRQSVSGLSADEKVEHKELLTLWSVGVPKLTVDLRPLYEAMGTDWGQLLFSGIGYFEGADGYLYVQTGGLLSPCMVEILGSEFDAAKAASKGASRGDC